MLYLGPEVLMPIASILAAIGGAILMFWNKLTGLFARLLGRPRPEPEPATVEEEVGAAVHRATDPGG